MTQIPEATPHADGRPPTDVGRVLPARLMRDILSEIGAWFDAARPFALATVVRTWQSSPRQAGASMAVNDSGEVVGSVSGGCVEGAVYDVCQEVLATGTAALVTYGVSDDDAFAVGLTCGGTVQLFVELITDATHPDIPDIRHQRQGHAAVAVATVIENSRVDEIVSEDGSGECAEVMPGRHLVVTVGRTSGGLGSAGLDHAIAAAARGMLEHGRTGLVHCGPDGQHREDSVTVFVESLAPPPTMFVFGATDFAAALVRTAKLIGYYVVVCDARPVFATTRRFPDADEVVVAWPHEYLDGVDVDERAVICVLTHDPKFDVPVLELALRTKAAYIGAMGSRSMHLDRLLRLREVGVDEGALARLSSPIGLDLGSRTPEETAISITAEIIATTWGGSGRRLRDVDDPIHR